MKQHTKLKLNEKQFDLLVEVLNKNNFEKLKKYKKFGNNL